MVGVAVKTATVSIQAGLAGVAMEMLTGRFGIIVAVTEVLEAVVQPFAVASAQ